MAQNTYGDDGGKERLQRRNHQGCWHEHAAAHGRVGTAVDMAASAYDGREVTVLP